MSNFLKATVVRDSAIRALARMLTLAPTTFRDVGSFRGAHNDTITLRVPAYAEAGRRAMRSSAARKRQPIHEVAVPVTLTDNIQRDVVLRDEHLSLDILDFSRQVVNPLLEGVARGIENVLLQDAILGATYTHTVTIGDELAAYPAIVQARKALTDSRVPDDGNRFLAVGSSVEAALLELPQFAHVDKSGTSQTLREGVIGRIAGFTTVVSPGLPPDEAYAYHRTAYALATSAPVVPPGAPAGFVASQDGFAIRLVQVLDSDTIENVVAADVFVGASATLDTGSFNDDGQWVPAEDPDGSDVDQAFVRGVKLTLAGSA